MKLYGKSHKTQGEKQSNGEPLKNERDKEICSKPEQMSQKRTKLKARIPMHIQSFSFQVILDSLYFGILIWAASICKSPGRFEGEFNTVMGVSSITALSWVITRVLLWHVRNLSSNTDLATPYSSLLDYHMLSLHVRR